MMALQEAVYPALWYFCSKEFIGFLKIFLPQRAQRRTMKIFFSASSVISVVQLFILRTVKI